MSDANKKLTMKSRVKEIYATPVGYVHWQGCRQSCEARIWLKKSNNI